MSAFEAALSLQPVSPEQPCGPNLQYDSEYIELERVSQGKPEQQYGETIIPAEEPDWREMKSLALSLQERTKDLRVACYLARAVLETDGLAEFCSCLSLALGYVEQYWDEVHPQLDPEDDNDPTERVNTLAGLADKTTTVAQILKAPLVRSSLGIFSMHDVLIARGEIPAPADVPPTDPALVEAAFMDSSLETLRGLIDVVQKGYRDAVALEDAVTDRVGSSQAVSMENLTGTLKSIHDYLSRQVRMRESETGELAGEYAEVAAADPGSAAPVAAQAQGISGEVRSREDVLRMLDKICDYYERSEPSSPVPMLLKRAKRLATKSFLDILEDLTPDGLSQARLIGGVESDSSEE